METSFIMQTVYIEKKEESTAKVLRDKPEDDSKIQNSTFSLSVYYAVLADDFGRSQTLIITINRYGIPLLYCTQEIYCSKT